MISGGNQKARYYSPRGQEGSPLLSLGLEPVGAYSDEGRGPEPNGEAPGQQERPRATGRRRAGRGLVSARSSLPAVGLGSAVAGVTTSSRGHLPGYAPWGAGRWRISTLVPPGSTQVVAGWSHSCPETGTRKYFVRRRLATTARFVAADIVCGILRG